MHLWASLILFFVSSFCFAETSTRATIERGYFLPLYNLDKSKIKERVGPFQIDKIPITNQAFYIFVNKHPRWKPENIPRLKADSEYLKHWSQKKPSKEIQTVPVTYVSWFAASAYCESRGGRLPTVLEWEYVAAASPSKKNASEDEAFNKKILKWYSKPFKPEQLPKVRKNKPNAWGIYDLHAMIWEWNSDFNSIFVTGDNRQDKDAVKNLFCGAGSLGASTKTNYPAFMRYALRNSLKASYTLPNLGFRCAYDMKGKK